VGRIAGVAPGETKAKLIDAAVQVFAQRGYEGARVTDIARQAGLSSGAIYAHYTSKAELLIDAIRAHGPDELHHLLDSGDIRMPLPDLLVQLAGSLEHRDPTQGSLLLEAMAASRRDPELAAMFHSAVTGREELIATLTRYGSRNGDVDPDVSPDAVARFCLMVVLGAMVARILDLPVVDPAEWTDLITRLVDGIRADPS
jgi:TetR/AcrR family transcriptional repressor of uid operon